MYFATAGQRIDPRRRTPFVWKEMSSDLHVQKMSLMSYTNWHPGTPDYVHGKEEEACVLLSSGRSYTWNDYPCSAKICSVCEIDM